MGGASSCTQSSTTLYRKQLPPKVITTDPGCEGDTVSCILFIRLERDGQKGNVYIFLTERRRQGREELREGEVNDEMI